MIQVIPATPENGAASGNHLAFPQCVSPGATAEPTPCMAPGTWQNWLLDLDVAPGAGNSLTFTVWKATGEGAASATGFAITISGTATQGNSGALSLATLANDNLHIRVTSTGTPAGNNQLRSVVEFVPTNARESTYSCRSIQPDASAISYFSPFTDAQNGSGLAFSTAAPATMTMPIPGTINGLAMKYPNTDFGTGRGYEVALYKNGVKQDGSGGTVDTRYSLLSGGSPSFAGSTTFSLHYDQGDTVYGSYTPIGSPLGSAIALAIAFQADVDREFIWAGATAHGPSTTVTSYTRMHGGERSFPSWNSTEGAGQKSLITSTNLSVDRLYMGLGTAPGSGDSWTFDGRLNGASPAGTLTVTIADAATTGSDLTNAIITSDPTDLLGMRATLTGTPAGTTTLFSMRVTELLAVIPDNPCTGGGDVDVGSDPADGAALENARSPLLWVTFHFDSGDLPISAIDLPDPSTYHGGHKESRLLSIGRPRRAVADQFGGLQTADISVTVIDTDYRFRTKRASETLEERTFDVWAADDAVRRAAGVARRLGRYVVTSVVPVGDMTFQVNGADFIGSVVSRFHADRALHDRLLTRTLFPQLPLALVGKRQPGYYGWVGDDSLPTLAQAAVALDHTKGYGGILDGGIYPAFGWGTVGVTGPASITLGEAAGGAYSSADTVYAFATAVVGGVETDPFPITNADGEDLTFTGTGKKLTLACPAVTGATAYRWYVCVNAAWGHNPTPPDARVRAETVTNSAELTDAGNENVGPWPPPDTNWTGIQATGQGTFIVLARYSNGLTPRQATAGFVKWGPWATRPSRIGWTHPASLPDEYWVISVIGSTLVNKWIVPNTEDEFDVTLSSIPDEVINGTFVQEGAIPLPYVGDELIGGTNYRTFLASMGVIRINALHGSDEGTPATRVQLDDAVYGTTFFVPGKTGWPFATLYRSFTDEQGEDQWFTLVYGLAGNAIVEAAVDGTVPLTVNTCGFAEDARGVDDDGDPSPTIDSLYLQQLHFLENFANPQDGQIWKSGPWKTPHTRDGVAVHNGTAFLAIKTYFEGLLSGGLKGAWGFSVDGEPFKLDTWLRAAAINGEFRWNTDEHGRLGPVFVDPDALASAAFSDGSVAGLTAPNIPNHAQIVNIPSVSRRINEIRYVYKKNYVQPVTKPTPAEDALLPPKLSESVDWYSGTIVERNDASQLAFGGGGGRRDVKPLDVQFQMHRTGAGPALIVARFLERWGFPLDVWRFPASLLGADVKNGQVVEWTHHAGSGPAGAIAQRLWLAASEIEANIEPGNPASLDVWLEAEDVTALESIS